VTAYELPDTGSRTHVDTLRPNGLYNTTANWKHNGTATEWASE